MIQSPVYSVRTTGKPDVIGRDSQLPVCRRHARLCSVTSSVLNHAVSGFEKNLSSVVQFQINLARDNDIEVRCVGSVHSRAIRFQDVDHPRQLLMNFFESRQNRLCRMSPETGPNSILR